MSNRNFDNRIIIQRLQNQVYARNLYLNNTSGQTIINNPQNSDGNSSRFNTYIPGAQTEIYRGLIGTCETISIGGIVNIPPFPESTAPSPSPSPPIPIISGWATNIGGTLNDQGLGITSDPLNNIYVTGFFNTNTFINSYSSISSGIILTDTFGELIGNGGQDAFITKYNSSGQVQWATNMGGILQDRGLGIASDSLNNIYVTGFFTNRTFINSYSSISSGIILTDTFGELISNGGQDIFITKYNSSGQVQWATNIGGIFLAEQGLGITSDSSNNIYVTGFFNNNTCINSYSSISSGIILTDTFGELISNGGQDAFITKYNSSGQVQWATNIGGILQDRGLGIASDSLNNIYVTGFFNTNTFINSYSSISSGIILTDTFGELIGNGNQDTFITKYNSSGQVQWATNIGGILNNQGLGITSDSLNNIYVTGFYFSTSIFINSYSSISSGIILTDTFGELINNGNQDAFITKYNSSGQTQWATNIGGILSDRGSGITSDSLNNIYVTGVFNERSFINSYSSISSGIILTDTFGELISNGKQDAFITKYNSLGQTQWATNIGGPEIDQGLGITSDSSNNIYVTGFFSTNTFINSYSSISSGIILTDIFGELIGNGGEDAFIIKYNSSGQLMV
jgi:hypothetical protein